jgi:hypothetical protein
MLAPCIGKPCFPKRIAEIWLRRKSGSVATELHATYLSLKRDLR